MRVIHVHVQTLAYTCVLFHLFLFFLPTISQFDTKAVLHSPPVCLVWAGVALHLGLAVFCFQGDVVH